MGLMILTGIIYGIWVDATFWKIYGVVLTIYSIFATTQLNRKETTKRKTVMISTWNQPSDPTSNIINEYNMDKAIAYVKQLNIDQKEHHITMTHFVALAMCWGLYKMRRDVGRLRWGSFEAAKEYGLTVLVDVEGGKDLVPVTIWDGHKKTIFEIAALCKGKIDKARKGKDERHNKTTGMAAFIPSFIAQPVGFITTYLGVSVGVPIGPLGLHSKSFGHLVLTNVGGMGFHSAIAPLCPPLHTLGLQCLGKIEKRAIVETKDGKDEIKVASMMTVIGTGDHRFGDAAIFVPYQKVVKGFIEDPANFDPTKYPENKPHWEKKDE